MSVLGISIICSHKAVLFVVQWRDFLARRTGSVCRDGGSLEHFLFQRLENLKGPCLWTCVAEGES